MSLRLIIQAIVVLLILNQPIFAQENEGDLLHTAVKAELTKRWPEAKVELIGPIRWAPGTLISGKPMKVSIREVTPKGEAEVLAVDSSNGSTFLGRVNYAAWIHALIPSRRIYPGEKLLPDLFKAQEINGALGQAYEYRGLIVARDTRVVGLEARQTILQGQFLISTAVQKIPDVRRGDSITIRLISGGLSVSTQGTAEESAYIAGRVRVIESRSKREFVGSLAPGGVVEVRL